MSYESELSPRTAKFINPTQLTLLLSIILHLLVYKFGFPSLKFNTDSGKREVSIVELSPDQQSRLPNLYPQLDLPNLPEVPTPPSEGTPAPPFALPRSLTPGVGDFPNLPPVNIPPPPNFDIPSLTPPPVTNIELPPIGDLSSLPLPPPIDSLDFEAKPSETATADPPSETPPPSESESPKTPPPPQAVAKPEDDKPQEPAQPQRSPQEIAAIRQQNLQQQVRNLSSSLQQREAGTSDEAARRNYIAWLSKVKEIEPEVIEIEGTYPRDACIRRLEGTSFFGVVVDRTGQVVALDLIKADKYPIFNEQAGKDIIAQEFANDTEKPKPYQVKVDYEYDAEICPSLSLPSLGRNERQPEAKPQPETQPQPEAKPQPESKPQPENKPQPEAKPQPETKPQPESKPQPEAQPQPETPARPSLRDRLRNIPLPERKPLDLKDIPLPDRPNL